MKKLVLYFQDEINCAHGRALRGAMASLSSEKYLPQILHHKHGISPIIYTKSVKNVVELYLTQDDKLLESEILNIILHPEFNLNGIKLIKSTIHLLQKDIFEVNKTNSLIKYSLRTPVIYAAVSKDIKYVDKLRFNEPTKLESFAIEKIKESINQRLCELGKPTHDLSDMKITFDDMKLFACRFKENELYPAFFSRYLYCNYQLPQFLGYKVGVGYGQVKCI